MDAVAPPTFSPLEDRPLKDTICLFDVDGTLTPARLVKPRTLQSVSRPPSARCFMPANETVEMRSSPTNLSLSPGPC